mmetsp:Transcript_134778/g.430705  ORF Transcript_134778/g.430705 Transcript_134778/m.430705 type:complete len:272 (-) Transcript_134778:1070-1885(-)
MALRGAEGENITWTYTIGPLGSDTLGRQSPVSASTQPQPSHTKQRLSGAPPSKEPCTQSCKMRSAMHQNNRDERRASGTGCSSEHHMSQRPAAPVVVVVVQAAHTPRRKASSVVALAVRAGGDVAAAGSILRRHRGAGRGLPVLFVWLRLRGRRGRAAIGVPLCRPGQSRRGVAICQRGRLCTPPLVEAHPGLDTVDFGCELRSLANGSPTRGPKDDQHVSGVHPLVRRPRGGCQARGIVALSLIQDGYQESDACEVEHARPSLARLRNAV